MEAAAEALWVLVTTFPRRDLALAAGRRLVAEELAACAQVGGDLVSFYRWRGEVREEAEVAMTLKVRASRYAACAARLRELHPYEVPQIAGWPLARVDPDYARWARGGEEPA